MLHLEKLFVSLSVQKEIVVLLEINMVDVVLVVVLVVLGVEVAQLYKEMYQVLTQM